MQFPQCFQLFGKKLKISKQLQILRARIDYNEKILITTFNHLHKLSIVEKSVFSPK